MKIFNMAMTMLKRETNKSIGYALVLSVSLIISFIFMDFVNNPILVGTDQAVGGGSYTEMEIPLSKGLPFIVVGLCCLMMLYVSNYYLNNKDSEFMIIFLSGGSMVDVSKYVLCQVAVILVIVTPISLLLGTILLNLIYQEMFSYINTTSTYTIPLSSYLQTLAALIPIIAVICISVSGFVHRNPLQTLLDRSESNGSYKMKKNSTSILYIIIYIGGLYSVFSQEHELTVYIFPGMLGVLAMYGMVKKTIPRIIQIWKNHKGVEKQHLYISLSNYAASLQGTAFLVLLMLVLVTGLIPVLVSQSRYTNEYATGVISYCVIIILIVVGVVCKFLDNVLTRKNEFSSLSRVGYIHEDLFKVIRYEVLMYYFTLILLPLPYLVSIGLRYVIYDALPISDLLFLLLMYIVPMLVLIIITNFLYIKTVIDKEVKYE